MTRLDCGMSWGGCLLVDSNIISSRPSSAEDHDLVNSLEKRLPSSFRRNWNLILTLTRWGGFSISLWRSLWPLGTYYTSYFARKLSSKKVSKSWRNSIANLMISDLSSSDMMLVSWQMSSPPTISLHTSTRKRIQLPSAQLIPRSVVVQSLEPWWAVSPWTVLVAGWLYKLAPVSALLEQSYKHVLSVYPWFSSDVSWLVGPLVF